MSTSHLFYILQIADNALINGHRLSEWCGHGPVLEQDIALSNIALDHLGQSRSFYQYAAQQFNAMDMEQKKSVFSSPAISEKIEKGELLDEDDLAFLRDSWDFRNVLLLEQPNRDWAYTVARSFFFDSFNYYFFIELQNSQDSTLFSIAEKSLKEITYHLRWSSEWMIRLGDGTDESHNRLQDAVNDYWSFTGEMMKANGVDKAMLETGIGVDLQKVHALFQERISSVLDEATLKLLASTWMQEGGKEGVHTEHLGYVLAELQYMQRAYPNMEW